MEGWLYWLRLRNEAGRVPASGVAPHGNGEEVLMGTNMITVTIPELCGLNASAFTFTNDYSLILRFKAPEQRDAALSAILTAMGAKGGDE